MNRHVLDDEVDELVLEHCLGMEVGDEEGDVISLQALRGLSFPDPTRLADEHGEVRKIHSPV